MPSNRAGRDDPAPFDLHLAFLERLGIALSPSARILDFGCGAGDAVELLGRRGFDCRGVDINPYWPPIWENRTALADRVSLLNPKSYRLPFPDGYFDFCFSDQVLEHVTDYPTVFRELGRVLKSQAVSLHRFPGANCLVEGHTSLPFSLLCRSTLYLALWARFGRRAPGQRDLSWRETLADNRRRMSETFYPSKRRLQRYAAEAGVTLESMERRELAGCATGGLAELNRRAAGIGLGGLAQLVLPLFAQRYMLLRRVTAAL